MVSMGYDARPRHARRARRAIRRFDFDALAKGVGVKPGAGGGSDFAVYHPNGPALPIRPVKITSCKPAKSSKRLIRPAKS